MGSEIDMVFLRTLSRKQLEQTPKFVKEMKALKLKSHLAPSIRAKLKAANIHVFCLPPSMTHKYQLVDVYIAALLKRCIAKQWALWISLQLKKAYEGGNDNEEVFMQQSGNYIKPSLALCVI